MRSGIRTCKKCGVSKPLSEFGRGRQYGRKGQTCRTCIEAQEAPAYNEGEAIGQALAQAVKRCSDCGRIKPLSEFHRQPNKRDGHFSRCKSCHNADHRKRYAAGKDLPPDYRWKTDVVKGQDYTCQDCGLRHERIVEAHHVVPVSVDPAKRFNLDNGITLCPNCHKLRHLALDDAAESARDADLEADRFPLWSRRN